jgi:hypothetical protein
MPEPPPVTRMVFPVSFIVVSIPLLWSLATFRRKMANSE